MVTMKILVTGQTTDRQLRSGWDSGFTLIELLIVLVIIAVLYSLVTLSSGMAGPERRLQQKSQQIAALIRAGCEEALVTANPVGVLFAADQFLFLMWAQDQWIPYPERDTLRARLLGDAVTLNLVMQGIEQDLEREPDPLAPHLICYPSGEMTPFRLQIVHQGAALPAHLSGAPDGRVVFNLGLASALP